MPEMKQTQLNGLSFDTFRLQTKKSDNIKPNNVLEKSPQQDEFQHSKVPKTNSATNIITFCASAIAAGATGYAILKGKENLKLKTAISDATEEIEKIKKALLSAKSDIDDSKDAFVEEYQKLIKHAQLGYDPLKAPYEEIVLKKFDDKSTIFKLSGLRPFKPKAASGTEIFDVEAFKNLFRKNGKLEISFPTTDLVEPITCENAKITKNIDYLGKEVFTDQSLNYGNQIKWSNKKIARDVLQNFYDGHSNTLDGVKMFIETLPNGEIKIRIEGQGIYRHTQLKIFGDSEKSAIRTNAGGFGEGAKVLSNALLASNKTDRIRYGSSNWILDFFGGVNHENTPMMMSKTSITDDVLNGNFIEFTTKDADLVDSIIEATNYFKHSKNPDFMELDFLKGNFGFKILDGDKKGNIYLTQRFEYDKAGVWDFGLENLRLILQEKPNPEEFKRITGKEFNLARDRMPITPEEIRLLTRYFAHKNMSDEELSTAIISTMPLWEKTSKSYKITAIGEFLKGLIEEAEKRKIGIDIEDQKFVANTHYNDTVKNYLQSYGFKYAPKELADLGIPKCEDMFKFLSVHQPIEPNPVEIQKLKLLEEAMVQTLKKIDAAFFDKLPSTKIVLNSTVDAKGESYKIAHLIKQIFSGREIADFVSESDAYPETFNFILEMPYEKLVKFLKENNLDLNNFILLHQKGQISKKIIEKYGFEYIQNFVGKRFIDEDSLVDYLKRKSIEELAKLCEKANLDFNEIFHESINSLNIQFEFDFNKLITSGKISFNELYRLANSEKGKEELDSYISTIIGNKLFNMNDGELNALMEKINLKLQDKLATFVKEGDKESIIEIINKIFESSELFENGSIESLRTLQDFALITERDVRRPRYIFDRFSQIANRTLGESIVDIPNMKYYGHWVDKTYLDNATFDDLYATWLHEICHKGGGDGSAEFTYILTDMIKIIASSNAKCAEPNKRLRAIELVFNKLPRGNEAK